MSPAADGALWVLTGLSGAGKATALRALEARGIGCVDNLPLELLEALRALSPDQQTVAVVDARQGEALRDLQAPLPARVIFLDARDSVLVRRIAESTRPHPCAEHGRGAAAVTAERVLLGPLRAAADVVIDTSELSAAQLGERVLDIVLDGGHGDVPTLAVTVSSFGHKHGPQLEADWTVDTRMLDNPFWRAELRPLSGLDPAVRDHVLGQPAAAELLRQLHALLAWSIPRYEARGRRHLHVACGCTGGRHRSVVIAEELGRDLRDQGRPVRVLHRDLGRGEAAEATG